MGLDETIISAARLWNLDVKEILKDKGIAGSPERCEFRFVVQDMNNKLYIIESLIHGDVAHKQAIIGALNFLSKKGMDAIQPYLPGPGGDYILSHKERFWQIIPFVNGVSLERPNYVFDMWRGKAVADFLIQLRATSGGIPGFSAFHGFSIKNYIYRLLDRIKEYEPELFTEVLPFVDYHPYS